MPPGTQRAIVTEIEAEQTLAHAAIDRAWSKAQ